MNSVGQRGQVCVAMSLDGEISCGLSHEYRAHGFQSFGEIDVALGYPERDLYES